MFKAIETLLA